MSVDVESVFHPEIKHRPGWQKALPWVIAVVAVGGAIAAGIIWSNTGKRNATPLTNLPADDRSTLPPTVKVTPGATLVALKFIRNAVARKILPEAYAIVTDQIRQGQSRRSW